MARSLIGLALLGALTPTADAGAVVGGEPTEPGRFDAVGRLDVGCTAVLVAPSLVATAAHCPAANTVTFGPDARGHHQAIGVTACIRHHDGGPGSRHDVALCELRHAPLGIEPLAVFVEPALGQRGHVVGYGLESDDDVVGTKRVAEVGPLQVTQTGLLRSRSESASICAGDSGGPLLVRDDGGGWRIAGLASGTRSPSCDGSPGLFVPADELRVAIARWTATPIEP